MPRKTFVGGEILLASELNGFLMDQSVMVFDDAGARATAIPAPVQGMVTYLNTPNRLERFNGSAFVPVNTGFTASTTITASNASFPVPALGSPIVKVTVIGGGGGAGGVASNNRAGDGGVTTFNPPNATAASAAGGRGGFSVPSSNNVTRDGQPATLGFSSGNQGNPRTTRSANFQDGSERTGVPGTPGAISVAYLNLTGVSNVAINIGAGGNGIDGGSNGGRGEVILEFVAA